MYVCICNAVTDSEIERAIRLGARSVSDLQMTLGVGISCGSCREQAGDLLRRNCDQHRFVEPVRFVSQRDSTAA